MSKPTGQRVTKRTTQYIQNLSVDPNFDVLAVEVVESDGTNLRVAQTKLMNIKVTVSGNDTYVGKAPIGTAQATAGWQAFKVAVSGGDTTILYADANANFDNVSTDLTALSYS